MDLVNQVRTNWCPFYMDKWEKSRKQEDMFVPCDLEETILTDIDGDIDDRNGGDCRITQLFCKNCSLTLTIFSLKESRLKEIEGKSE